MRFSSLHVATLRKAVWATVLCASISSTAASQFPAGRGGSDQHMVRVGFGGGMTVPISDAGDALKTGVNGQGFILFQLAQGLPALRFALSYDRYGIKQPTAPGFTQGGEDEAGHTSVLGGVGGIKIHIVPGPIRPYVMAGLGAFNVTDALNAANGGGSTSNLNFGVDGGAGLDIKLGRLEAFVEGRIQNIYQRNGSTGTATVIDRKSIQAIPITFGLLF